VTDIICGGLFGDEGKGVTTDYYASKYNDSLVIRYNSSAQASHTVTTPDGRRHAFSHFGSGSFNNSKTYLSKYFSSHPMLFFKEKEILNKLGVNPIVYADSKGIISVPYDVLINQILEQSRGNNRHGSCGIGFNETVERNLIDEFSIKIEHLPYKDHLIYVLEKIRKEYVPKRMEALGIIEHYEPNKNMFDSDNILYNFMGDLLDYKKSIIIDEESTSIVKSTENIIFEGAQGLLLDENSKYFPHVTRSSTGLKNVVDIANTFGIDELNVNYIARCYITKHGNGPMPFECEKPYENIVDLTNIPNDWQGSLRFAPFNFDLLNEAISNDLKHKENYKGTITTNLVVTCLDQVDENIRVILNDSEIVMEKHNFIILLKEKYSNLILSYGPTRETIVLTT